VLNRRPPGSREANVTLMTGIKIALRTRPSWLSLVY
jgi:hypothetical protein